MPHHPTMSVCKIVILFLLPSVIAAYKQKCDNLVPRESYIPEKLMSQVVTMYFVVLAFKRRCGER